jgi:Leucine-rich repeat (LRR) protein
MAAIASFQSSGFTIIQFRNIPADDQTLEVIGRFKALKQLRLRHTQITDAGMTHLSGLKSLDSLDVSETRISIAGMKALAGAQLTELGFGMSPDDMAAVTQELAVLFPKVADFQYPPGGTTAARHLNALGKAWPKLKRLEFPSYHEFEPDAFISAGPLFPTLEYLYLWRTKINDSHMPGIVQMKKLNTLVLHDTQVTDAALTELQKLNSLKKIYLNDTKVTEAGLTAFKKARRDVFVSGGRP